MDISPVTVKPIGVIRSPFQTLDNMPIQPKGAADVTGELEIFPEYTEGLKDLDRFSHIYLLYHFHEAGPEKMLVKPFMDDTQRGVFATRAPVRPSYLGLSVVQLVGIEGSCVHISGIDVLDGTPLLDIKPYIEKFDHPDHSTSGWMQADTSDIRQKRSDSRFT